MDLRTPSKIKQNVAKHQLHFYLPPWTHKASSKYVIYGNFPLNILISTYTIISRWIRTTCHCQKTAKDNTKVLSLSTTQVVDKEKQDTQLSSVLPRSYECSYQSNRRCNRLGTVIPLQLEYNSCKVNLYLVRRKQSLDRHNIVARNSKIRN